MQDTIDKLRDQLPTIDVTNDMEQAYQGPKYYRDEDNQEWCACDQPELIHNSGRGQAKCIDCQRPWFH